MTAKSQKAARILGGPRPALTWIANYHTLTEQGLRAEQMFTTGVPDKPAAIKAGDRMYAGRGFRAMSAPRRWPEQNLN